MTPYEQANDPATPGATLDRLAGDEDGWVRYAVARHPATPANAPSCASCAVPCGA
jgi:hypothetical protein